MQIMTNADFAAAAAGLAARSSDFASGTLLFQADLAMPVRQQSVAKYLDKMREILASIEAGAARNEGQEHEGQKDV